MVIYKQEPAKSESLKVNSDEKIPDFPVVGTGASSGGLEALEQFFGNMRPRSNDDMNPAFKNVKY